ncbi:MAG: hypothetical protein IPM29_28940 [Planctomycetes bacterium]|nr:hypothetical protein [Planctomycetota bacterium]
MRPALPSLPLAAIALAAAASAQQSGYVHFEPAPTHAVAVLPGADRLVTVDTADDMLCVWSLADPRRPVSIDEIRVGLGPIAVRPRSADEVWVVNFASDSISVVSLRQRAVVATIATADEPGDVVFAGRPARAFVATATDRKVQVFDPDRRALVGEVPVFCDDPRALEVSADGSKVWVASYRSGNGTTIVPVRAAPPPPPPVNPALPAAPPQGIIVRHDDPQWHSTHGVTLPDWDVFEIDARTAVVTRRFSGVGTVNFDVALRPGAEELWVANTEARNLVRFVTALRGHVVDNRITKIDLSTGVVTPIDLNPTIDYRVLPDPVARATALAQPTDTVFAPDGSLAYVAAFGTDRIGVLEPSGRVVGRIDLGSTSSRDMRGPRALAHHPTQGLLYVHSRIANSLAVVDTVSRTVIAEVGRPHDPTPSELKEGRGFLYDARLSGNGTVSCASCHVDGTTDNLAWDLGDPTGDMEVAIDRLGRRFDLHPMKGPMVTQTFQGLEGTQPFHWRGDRATLADFNPTFDDLFGSTPLPAAELATFDVFLRSIRYMANPRLNLDRSLPTEPVGASAAEGEPLYMQQPFNGFVRCVDCHSLPTGTNGVIFDGRTLQTPQAFEVAQLRNAYKRDGRTLRPDGRTAGFGYTHDGELDTVSDFLGLPVFGPLSRDPVARAKIAAFVMAFDTGTAPTVGFQLTFDAANVLDPALRARLQALLARAAANDCAVVVHGVLDGQRVGMVHDAASGRFLVDRAGESPRTLTELDTELRAGRALLTFTGVPLGEGVRLGVDRDRDGILDRDEGIERYGEATPAACSPALGLLPNTQPRLGDAGFAIVVDGIAPALPSVMLVGFARASLPLFDIELRIDPTGSFGVDFGTDARSQGVVSAPIPADPALVGGTLLFQAAQPSSCGALSLQLSPGLAITVQAR